jgi:hypothetical protein
MYLTEVKTAEVIKKQFIFKLKSNAAMFLGLIALQIVGFCSSIGFGGLQGMGVYYMTYSTSTIFAITITWVAFAPMFFTQKKNRDVDFTFVGSRLTGSLSNIAATSTICIIGAVTVTLYEFLFRVVVTLRYAGAIVDKVNLYPPLSYFLIELLAVMLYFLLIASFIYFFSTLVRGNIAFVFFAAIVLIFTFASTISSGDNWFLQNVVYAITKEKLIWLFAVKAVAASAVFFALGALISSRVEVRK